MLNGQFPAIFKVTHTGPWNDISKSTIPVFFLTVFKRNLFYLYGAIYQNNKLLLINKREIRTVLLEDILHIELCAETNKSCFIFLITYSLVIYLDSKDCRYICLPFVCHLKTA